MRLLCVVTVLVCLQLGCETRVSLGNACRNDTECSGALRCNFGRCRAGCTDSAQCSAGEHCLTINGTQGACTLPTDTCNPEAQRYCEDGLVCVNEECVSLCAPTTNACLPGTSCNATASACLPMSIVLPDAGPGDGGMDASVPTLDAGDVGPDAYCMASTAPPTSPRTVCVGEHFGCAIQASGVYCWGSNDGGQLGDGERSGAHFVTRNHGDANDSDFSAVPVRVLDRDGPLSGVTSLACGTNFACALRGNDISCWGTMGSNGALPVAEPFELMEAVSELYAGSHHACARIGSEYRCWGENSFSFASYPTITRLFDGRLGNEIVETTTPIVSPDFAGAARIEVGSLFTCSLECGGVYCQGVSQGAVCGNVPVPGVEVAVPVANRVFDRTPTDIHTGLFHACVLSDDVVSCFGGNGNEALGRNDDTLLCQTTGSDRCRPNATPIALPAGLTRRFVALAHGIAATSCALDETGLVYCWGQNDVGQAGVDDVSHNWTRLTAPVRLEIGGDLRAAEVAVGASSTCARTTSGQVLCWGDNTAGQLGLGTEDSVRRTSAVVVPL